MGRAFLLLGITWICEKLGQKSRSKLSDIQKQKSLYNTLVAKKTKKLRIVVNTKWFPQDVQMASKFAW